MVDQTPSLRDHQLTLLELLREFDRVCKALDIPYILFAGTMLGAVRHQGFVPWDDDLDVLMHRRDYERFLAQADRHLDREKFFLQKEFSDHWPMFFSKLRMNNTTCLEKYHPRDPMMHQGIYMDIFPCDNALRSDFGRRCQFAASKIVVAKCLYRRGYDTDSRAKWVFMHLCRLLPMKPFLALTKAGREDSEYVNSFLGGSRIFSKGLYSRHIFRERLMTEFEGELYPIPERYDALLTLLYDDYMTIPSPEERQIKQHALLIDLNQSYEAYRDYRDGMKFEVYTRSIR